MALHYPSASLFLCLFLICILYNTVSTNTSNLNISICGTNFIFNQSAQTCQINCSSLAYATGLAIPNTTD
jgi:hypothetical protein